jgi:hypothetical protein
MITVISLTTLAYAALLATGAWLDRGVRYRHWWVKAICAAALAIAAVAAWRKDAHPTGWRNR